MIGDLCEEQKVESSGERDEMYNDYMVQLPCPVECFSTDIVDERLYLNARGCDDFVSSFLLKSTSTLSLL